MWPAREPGGDSLLLIRFHRASRVSRSPDPSAAQLYLPPADLSPAEAGPPDSRSLACQELSSLHVVTDQNRRK